MSSAPARGPSIPPVYLVVSLVLMGVFHLLFPLSQVFPPPYRYAGVVLIGLALALILWSVLIFHRRGTGIVPFTAATALVAEGPFRYTRNPMYVGMAGILLGTGVLLGSVTPFIVIPAFVALISERFILAEEAMLEETFGASYAAYKARVHRWL